MYVIALHIKKQCATMIEHRLHLKSTYILYRLSALLQVDMLNL